MFNVIMLNILILGQNKSSSPFENILYHYKHIMTTLSLILSDI